MLITAWPAFVSAARNPNTTALTKPSETCEPLAAWYRARNQSANATGIVKHARSGEREARVSETTIAFTDLLGRRVRMGPWEDQKVSTYRKIIEALEGGRWDEAATLGSYFVDEANVCFTLYRQWIGDLNGFLRDKGVDADVIQARNDQAVAVATLPDGTPWLPRKHWDRFLSEVQAFTAATYRERPDEARRRLDTMKETWRQCHDRDVDHTYALMSLIKEQLGEDCRSGRCSIGSCCRCSCGAMRSSTSTSTRGTSPSRS